MLYKPDGFLSQFSGVQKVGDQNVLSELNGASSLPAGTEEIGRLDLDSEGLLLLTRSGVLKHYMLKARAVEKEYFAQVS